MTGYLCLLPTSTFLSASALDLVPTQVPALDLRRTALGATGALLGSDRREPGPHFQWPGARPTHEGTQQCFE